MRFKLGAFGLLVAGSLVLAGCGGAASSPAGATGAAPTQAASAPAAAPSDAPSAAAASSGAKACADGVPALITAHVGGSSIVEIKIIGGCHQASIATSLAPTDVTKGLAICDAAAEVGYTDGVSSITVDAQDGKELAAGLKDSSCIGEP